RFFQESAHGAVSDAPPPPKGPETPKEKPKEPMTRQQFAEYFLHSGGGAFHYIPWAGQSGPQVMMAARLGMGQKSSAEDMNKALMKLLDKDGDGKLSRAELAAAPEILLKLDADEDEIITPDEIVPPAPFSPFG